MYLVEVEHHVVAELAGAEQLPLLGDLETVSHGNGVEHLCTEGSITLGARGTDGAETSIPAVENPRSLPARV